LRREVFDLDPKSFCKWGKIGVKRQKIAFLIDGKVPESQCFLDFRKFLEFLLALALDEC
jgi:hypothetical protein